MVALALSLLVAGTGIASAQTGDTSLPALAERLAGMTAITGFEQAMVDTILTLLPGAVRDRAGNAVLTLGAGDRARLVACPVSEPGYVVGRVRPDGWMTLRRAPGRVTAGSERQLEGQRVTVFGRRGALPGVVGVRSIHLTRGGDAGTAFALDSAYLDIGAASAAEVAAAGIGVLSPLTVAKRPHRYGDGLLAAPVAGRRAACAALVTAASQAGAERGMVPRGERIVIAFVVEQELGRRGLATVAHMRGPFAETVVVDGAGAVTGLVQTPDTTGSGTPALGAVSRWSVGIRYAGTAVETVDLAVADSLQSRLAAWMAAPR